MMGVCSFFLSKDYDIPHMLSNSNFECPMRKGINYCVYKGFPNATNMPPLIPEGRWKLQAVFMYLNRYIMWSVDWYTSIEYINIFG
ncbi:hypothetical protein ILUMI_16325 [Ignelater luminosus]|uniref:Uncharacterized protein n=1 Tax=Ignelater luminosus TaxID=2038154 RepID=A0A8K0CSI0_IGNLU|nr:hypothetical protein ILUMI_16325 [Ignelater luminosus]